MSETKQRLAAIGTALAIALGAAGVAGCGDDDEGPAEEAGQAIDEAGEEVGKAAEEAGKEIDENVDVDVGDEGGKDKAK